MLTVRRCPLRCDRPPTWRRRSTTRAITASRFGLDRRRRPTSSGSTKRPSPYAIDDLHATYLDLSPCRRGLRHRLSARSRRHLGRRQRTGRPRCRLHADLCRRRHETVPIQRRFAIQQSRIQWGASAFAAIPHQPDGIYRNATEERSLGRVARAARMGAARHATWPGATTRRKSSGSMRLPNPHPDKPSSRITLTPGERVRRRLCGQRHQLTDHPLRPASAAQAAPDAAAQASRSTPSANWKTSTSTWVRSSRRGPR